MLRHNLNVKLYRYRIAASVAINLRYPQRGAQQLAKSELDATKTGLMKIVALAVHAKVAERRVLRAAFGCS
jgi:hypothetical protein